MEVVKLFDDHRLVNVCAPMVRYSKLEFRSLVRKYNCHLCFTPMIMADSFVMSQKARNNEFTTDSTDQPLVVQFAATNADDFVNAAELVSPYSNGVDLNCGCPQRWAMKIGVGAQMLNEPETIKDMVRQVKNRVRTSFSVSVKMRLLSDIRASVLLCQQLENAGADFLSVHGRTKDQKSDPIDIDAIKAISSTVRIPVIANGDIKSIQDAENTQELTGCRGVMSARGLLQNPAMFAGASHTPRECVEAWLSIALTGNLHFITFHHHLVFMLEKVLPKDLRRKFNNLNSYEKVIEFLNDFYGFNFVYDPVFSCSNPKDPLFTGSQTKGKFFEETVEADMFLNELFVAQ